jgi:hypothetical protein
MSKDSPVSAINRWRGMPALCAAALALLPAAAIAGDAASAEVWRRPAMVPVRVLLDGLNSGDTASVEKVHASTATIVDEIPPYYWTGPGAYTKLMRDFDVVGKEQGIEEFVVTPTSVDQVQATDERAYVVVSANVLSKTKGVTSRQSGRFIIALTQEAGAWKIVHWSWAINPSKAAAEATP